ncbi:Uncharacterized protein TCM_027221 [Theobroma cacao]|uniref:RNase H type-1 domain-containing protein n=1 Tax=Theobroma cacao TaxID=3641 RepID=A0A061G8F2_THECC|nr:Uncharacterized protein TCM_027221 [Theobroma cacao]
MAFKLKKARPNNFLFCWLARICLNLFKDLFLLVLTHQNLPIIIMVMILLKLSNKPLNNLVFNDNLWDHRKKCDWGKPSMGFMKFNIDGAARGCPSPSSMGGAMHNHEEDVKILFSKPLGHGDSNMAEILAIKEAFYLFVAFSWCFIYSLINESDSFNAVCGLTNHLLFLRDLKGS